MHTTFSDGAGTIPELVEAAHEAQVRWIIVTDHDTLEGLPFAGWQDEVLVLVGHEVTPVHSHYLVLGVNEVISNRLPTQQYIDLADERGAFGIIAHPDDHLQDKSKGMHPWADWAIDGPSNADSPVGLELWNVMADWRAETTPANRVQLLENPGPALRGPTPAVMAWWDRLHMSGRRVVGIGGLDAHATRLRHAVAFPYAWMFGTVTNYVLLDAPLAEDGPAATRQVLDALRGGHSYFVNRLDGTAPDLPFLASQGDTRWYPGDSPTLADGPLLLHAEAGNDAELRLIGNGELLASGSGSLEHPVEQPGVYRLEGHRNGRLWLCANPIYVMA